MASMWNHRLTEARVSVQPERQPAQRTLFVNVQEMKQKIKENTYKPKYNVVDLYHDHGWAQYIARHQRFEQVGLAVIALNALWIAIDTDYNHSDVLYQAQLVFPVAENIFCIFFLLEWLCRYFAFQKKCDSLRDAWFVFDGSLVFMMVIETWVVSIILAATGFSLESRMGDVSILRVVRLLRLTRMARMARLLRAVPELMILIKGMRAAFRSVFFTLCLLVAIIYVFAVGFVQLTKDTEFGDKYFNRVSRAMFTLLLRGTYLDEITELMDDMRNESVFLVIFFLAFVLLAAQTVTGMLIGVLCEVVTVVASAEKEEMMMSFVVKKIGDILESLDYDKDRLISKKEFMMMLGNTEAARTLQEVGVDAVSLVDFTDVIFAGDDHDEEASLTFEEFMDVVLQFRGTNTATVKDVIESQKILRNGVRNVAHHLRKIEEALVQSGVIEPVMFGRNTFSMQSWSLNNSPLRQSLTRNASQCKQNNAVTYNSPRPSNDLLQSIHVPAIKEAAQCPHANSDTSSALGLASNITGSTAFERSLSPFEKTTSTCSSPRAAQAEKHNSSNSDSSIGFPKDLRTANLLHSLSSQMLAIHRSVTEGHASMHRVVSAHLDDELQLRTAAEREVARLQEQNQQLRDLLASFEPDTVNTQLMLHVTSHNVPSTSPSSSTKAKKGLLTCNADAQSVSPSDDRQEFFPIAPLHGQQSPSPTHPAKASTLLATTAGASPLDSAGDSQQASASSVRPPSASTGQREGEDSPSIAPLHGQSPITMNRAKAESNPRAVRAADESPAPNHALPHPQACASSR